MTERRRRTISPLLLSVMALIIDGAPSARAPGGGKPGKPRQRRRPSDPELPREFGFDEYCLWQHLRRSPRYANPGLEILRRPGPSGGPSRENEIKQRMSHGKK